tara:strand:- start:476 stop:1804 length:1329 start_codon:yes stop_codon:yes gene_type:complete
MPVDARIALAGIPQEYNAFGAYNTSRAAEQTFRQNQMIQQAARDTAEMNRNAMAAAQTLDPTDQAAMRAYVARYGPAAAPIIEGLSGVDNMFTARNTDARAQGEFDTKQRVDLRDFLQREVGSFLNDPSDANIAASRARAIATGIDAADFDAYVAPYTALPVEQRPDRLRNELATSADGLKLLERFAPAYDMQNAGGSIVPVQTNPLAPGATPPRPITVTADPNRQQLVQDANGNWVSVNPNTNSGAPVTLPDGSPVTGRVPGTPAPGTNADGTQAASAQTLRNVLGQLRTNFDVLYRNGFMRGGGGSPVGNVAQFIGDLVPGVRGARLAANSEADTASGNVEALLSTAISTLSALYGTSSRVMDAVKEMENARATFGGQNLTIEAARNMVDTALRRVDELEASRGGGGGADMPPVGARGATLSNSQTGATFVSDGTRWVPQ